MTNKPNFIGWSGKTEFTISDLINSNFSGNSQSLSNVSSRIIEGPITISNTPKDGPARTGSTEPIYQTGVTQTFSAFNLQSVNTVLGSNLPFTAGTVDYSFPAGSGFTEDGFNGAVYHIAVDANGKYVIGGGFTTYYYNGNSYTSNRLIRLNTDGTVDESFDIGFNNDCYGGGFNDTVYTLEIQPDGKILVGGAFTRFDRDGNCNDAYRIIRLNSDGSRDLSFNTGNGFDSDVYDIHIQPDGKILVGGDFRVYNDNTEAYRIIRLNTNGSIDSSFLIGGSGVSFDNYVNVIELQPNGKILVGGYFTQYGGVSQNYITRLNTDGTLDTTFQIGNGFNEEVYSLALQSDGKIIVGGYFNYFDNNDLFYGNIIRLNSNGTLDTLFGHGLDSEVHSLAIQSDGKILVGGYFNTYVINNASVVNVNKLIRFNSDGSFDYSFYSEQNSIYNDGVEYISILENDNILVGGFFNNYDGPDPLVYPLNYFGRIHNSISVYPYTYTVQACSQPLMNETITYVVGSMTPLSSNKTYSFQSLQNPSITVCGFITETYPSNVIEYSMVNEYNNCYDAYISNYKLVTLEDCIAPGINQSLPVWIVDNKYEINDILYVDIVFDGEGRTFNKFAAKITSVDPNWNVPFPLWEFLPPINYAPYSSCDEAIGANGLIYVAESCTEMETVFPLIYKPLYDSISLLIPTGNNPVKVISDYLPYGSYSLISGGTPEIFSTVDFGSYNDSYNTLCDLGLRKISPNGIESNNFLNTGFDGNLVYTMVEQPDGKILVGGNFSDYLEVSVGNFMRINPDGSLDETFNNVSCGQPIWSTKTPFESTTSGSIYFDGTPLCKLSVNTDQGVWDLENNNVTFEWFQYFMGDSTHLTPTAFDYSNNDLRVYFSSGYINVVIDGDNYSYELNSTINDAWCHIAVTRYYDPEEDVFIWRVFQNGIQLGQFNYSFSFNQSQPLTIGNDTNPYDNGGFKGNITNFRVNNGAALYTENFTVPTEPLNPNFNPDGSNTVLCLSVNNEADYILDNCDDEIPTSVNSPGNFINGGFNGYVRAIALQPDGKILVGGNFNYYNNSFAGNIIRLNSDGSIDQGFTYNDEFNGIVRAIAVQRDGKIVVGGGFDYYYDFYCPQIVRLNSDGTPDPTFIMGNGFDGDDVFTINIESIRNQPFFIPSGPTTYTENIVVGGWFNWYNGNNNIGGIVKLSPTGEVLPDFGEGFNVNEGGRPRVNQILTQPDGKIVVIGGADGGQLLDYNNTWIPQNIVRLFKDGNGIYQIDNTFTTRDFDNTGGFNNAVLSISLLPNGKYMVGGQFNYYGDNNEIIVDLPYLVRLNSDGTLDKTFTFMLDDDYVNKTLLLSSGKLLVGGRFNVPSDLLLELYIGEDYKLHSFNTCDGLTSNLFLPTDFPISTSSNGTEFSATPITYEPISTSGLDLVYDGDNDDDNFVVVLPTPFDVNFLGVNYTSVNVSTNPYITFGDGGNPSECCFDIPDEIPSNVELPGVFLSFQCPNESGNYDADMYQLYTGLTDGGNTIVIKYVGTDHCDEEATLVYGFKFYKDNSDYFDLIIENNDNFFNDDPTGGVSNGVDPTWVTTFDSTGGNAYRIGYSTNSNPIKANINERVAVCGTVGNIVTTPQLNGGSIGGSMYFDGNLNTMVQVDNSGGQFGFGGVFDFTIEWFQYYEGGSSSRPFSIGVYDNPNEMIGMSFEGSVLLWVNNVAYNTTIVNDDLLNGWHHMAITRNFDGSNRTWRVFLDGILKYEEINNNDTTNTYTLTLGNQLNNDGLFRGYITNFRVNNQTALYTSNFTVPTSPLPCDSVNFILTMNATDESGLLYDTCTDQTITATGVTWSTETPFINLNDFTLFTATNNTSYTSCDECLSTTKLNAITYQRDGVNPNKVVYTTLTQDYINNILTNGPIWTYGPYRECYELLTYYK